MRFFALRLLLLFLCIPSIVQTQHDTVRKVDNIVPNKSTSEFGINITKVGTIGKTESNNENEMFFLPFDITMDEDGNLYVSDTGNHRIQKFSARGNYIKTYGRIGQGPREFNYPLSVDIHDNELYVSDNMNYRIQVFSLLNDEVRTFRFPQNSSGLIKVLDENRIVMGSINGLYNMISSRLEDDDGLLTLINLSNQGTTSFCEPASFNTSSMSRLGNEICFASDSDGSVYVAFNYQNRIEKYSPDGQLLLSFDRKLNYNLTKTSSADGRESGGMRSLREAKMNQCSSGIAVDDQGRIWIVTLKRQITEDERIQTNVNSRRDASGNRSFSFSVTGNSDIFATDMYMLEVFSNEGVLLKQIPVDHFVDDIQIFGSRMFLADRNRSMVFYEYKIEDKN